MRRRNAPLLVATALLAVSVIVAATASLPYVTMSPGGAYNTLGEVDGTELITISGTTTYPTSGAFDLLTVSESGGPYGRVTLGDLVLAWSNPNAKVVPREWVFPDQIDNEAARREMVADFNQSQNAAIAASMRHLGTPLTTTVIAASVNLDGPSAGVIAPGDAVLSIGGKAVASSGELVTAVRAKPPGTSLSMVVRTGTDPERTVTVVSAPRPDKPSVPYIGITTGERYAAPFPITFGLTDVVGPSGGLMLTMAIVDKLTPGPLNGGRQVAGTGTISADGSVGAIGGIQQKMVAARDGGAELLLAPRGNCNDVVGHVPDGLVVVPVTTLDDAIDATADWLAGRPLPRCDS